MDERNLSKKEKRKLRRQEKISQIEKDRQKRAARRALGWVVILGLIAVAIFAIVSREDSVDRPVEIGNLRADDWTKGNRDASVVLIEYSDFQCPACAFYSGIVGEVVKEFPDDLLLIFRHFPLKTIHPNAEEAARAAEAAGKQGKFWEMHDLIFANQSVWAKEKDPKEFFVSLAGQLELDVSVFEDDYGSKEIADKVSESYGEAVGAGLSATPTFIINGNEIGSSNMPSSLEEFIELINDNIKRDNS
jgi:protein-disulfide isomerase